MAFCVPLKHRSILCWSTFNGVPQSVATASTTSSAPTSSATLRKSSMGLSTPVDVSPWHTPINLILRPLAALRTSFGSTVRPSGASTR